jgi:hypothetical protein
MNEPPLRIYLHHLRAARGFRRHPGICARGAKNWCATHGIDWRAFVRDGIPAQTLLDTGDALAERLVEFVRDRTEGTG